MKLIDAVQLKAETSLALVGAGGKTTAMFRLARQWVDRNGGAALVTTTTHLAEDELEYADYHLTVSAVDDLKQLRETVPQGVVVVTGPVVEQGRVGGLEAEALEGLKQVAEERQLPLLVEADGSARRPLKAPAAHEPVIPPFVNLVISVVGMQAFGKPLNDAWVHRADLFAALTGLQPEAEITQEAIADMLLAQEGGLKGIPSGTQKMVLFNQCDTDALASAGRSIAQRLLPHYQRVIYAALKQEGDQEVIAANHPVAGLVLAAGGSERIGQPKQLLDWEGKPFVRVAAETALKAGLSPVIVVLGAAAQKIEPVLDGLAVEIIHNLQWRQGQSTSLKAGLDHLPPETQAVVMLLVDQPHIPHALISALVEAHAENFAPIVAPLVDQRRGNPVLFDRAAFDHLVKIEGDIGGRAIFSHFRVLYVPWIDPRTGLDVDTEEDYKRLLDAWRTD